MASVYRSRNGSGWTAQVNTGGRRRSKAFATKVEARRWATREEAEAARSGRGTGGRELRFGDLIEAVIAHEFEHGEPSRSRLGAIRHIAELLGRRPLSELDVDALRAFARTRRAEGAGPATIAMDFAFVHSLLSTGGALLDAPVERPLVAYRAARKILSAAGALARPAERTRRPSDLELLELRDFWARRRRGIPMWALTLFAICSAMRLSEICRLRWDDLDRERRTILVRDRKHPTKKAGNHSEIPLLRGPVTVGGELIDPLALIDAQPVEDPLIFPYAPATVSTNFTRGAAAIGAVDLRFHDLRHDGASRLFEAGYAVQQVAVVTGHKTWAQLKRYTNLDPSDLHRDR